MIYDVTVPITNAIAVWPSDPPVKLTSKSHPSSDRSHTIRLTKIEMGSHTGTHIDAPCHFVDGGKALNEIPLSTLVGRATLFELPRIRSIERRDLENLDLDGVERVLFKTENSKHWSDGKFFEEFVYLEPEGAGFLVEKGVKLVGIDYLSIDKFTSDKHPTHFVLLERNVVILEGLNLQAVPPGQYNMTALPLNLTNVDGAPTRVILQKIR
jgi:arylformamidase